ncbi:MAG: helix-turn-helix domain-containing protein [Oscillospiraceae bacterium]|jgi:transcriptional regulator with XRE-family HTH domain|nr:helix-turn-helix domain-containing protein [Oscillospiraceae bacterium]
MRNITLLSDLRKANGLTQQQVADYLHLDRSTYAYYESGRTKVNVEILIRLATFFKVPLAFLAGVDETETAELLSDGTGEGGTNLPIDDAAARFAQLNREEQYLIILFRSGNPGQRQQLLQTAKAITAPEKKNKPKP